MAVVCTYRERVYHKRFITTLQSCFSRALSASLSKAAPAPSRTSTRHGLLNSGPSSIPGDPRRGTRYRFRGCAARIRSDSSQPARTGAAGWVSVQCAGAAEDGQHTRADRARRVRRHGARDAADAACAVRGHGMQAAGTRERTRVACEARAHARRLWNPLKTHTVAACRLRLFLFRSRIVCRTSQRCCDCVGQATVAERTQQVRRIRLPRAG